MADFQLSESELDPLDRMYETVRRQAQRALREAGLMTNPPHNPPLDLDDLRRLAITQPLVHAALVNYDYGDVSFEDMLIGLVLALSEALEQTQEALHERMTQGPPIYHLTLSAEQMEAMLRRQASEAGQEQ